MELVSLYEKWDRKWNSLEGVSFLASIGHLSSGFLLLSCKTSGKKKHEYRQRRKRQIVPTPCVTVSNLIPYTI